MWRSPAAGAVLLLALGAWGCLDLAALDRCEEGACPVPCVSSISAGWSHTCIVKADGSVWCWGNNNAGQLGQAMTPEQLANRNTPGQVVGLSAMRAISAGGSHNCVLDAHGDVHCWGYNSVGQLGDADDTDGYSTSPVDVSGLAGVLQLASAEQHTCAVGADHSLVCWGDDSDGQLGDGQTTDSATPVHVALQDSVEVATGIRHGCALDTRGAVRCWGANEYGQLGDGTTVGPRGPASTPVLTDVAHIGGGLHHTCAIKKDGSVWCWGLNNVGQLGENKGSGQESHPVSVGPLPDAAQLSLGGYETIGPYGHSCARANGGALRCWGANTFGEIGDNTNVQRNLPVLIDTVPDAALLAVGAKHTCIVRKNGTVWCWGANEAGQLGTGDYNGLVIPVGAHVTCP